MREGKQKLKQTHRKSEMMRSWACQYKPVNSDLRKNRQEGIKVKGGRTTASGQSQSGKLRVTPPPNKKSKQGQDRAEGPNPQNQEFKVSSAPSSS